MDVVRNSAEISAPICPGSVYKDTVNNSFYILAMLDFSTGKEYLFLDPNTCIASITWKENEINEINEMMKDLVLVPARLEVDSD